MLEYIENLREDIATLEQVAPAVDGDDSVANILAAGKNMSKALTLLEEAEPHILKVISDNDGTLPVDDTMGFGIVEDEDNDIRKLSWFLSYGLIIHSELLGDPIFIHQEGRKDPDAQDYQRMSKWAYLRDCANTEMKFVYHQIHKNPEEFNVPGYARRIDSIVKALSEIHTVMDDRDSLSKINKTSSVITNLEESLYYITDYLVIRGFDLDNFTLIEDTSETEGESIKVLGCTKDAAFLTVLRDRIFD